MFCSSSCALEAINFWILSWCRILAAYSNFPPHGVGTRTNLVYPVFTISLVICIISRPRCLAPLGRVILARILFLFRVVFLSILFLFVDPKGETINSNRVFNELRCLYSIYYFPIGSYSISS